MRKAVTLIEMLMAVALVSAIIGAAVPFLQGQRPPRMEKPFFPADQEVEFLKRRVHLLEVAYESMDRRISLMEGLEKK